MKRITQNTVKEVSKGECIIMGDFNHGHIQWKSLESTGGEDQQFLFLIQKVIKKRTGETSTKVTIKI